MRTTEINYEQPNRTLGKNKKKLKSRNLPRNIQKKELKLHQHQGNANLNTNERPVHNNQIGEF